MSYVRYRRAGILPRAELTREPAQMAVIADLTEIKSICVAFQVGTHFQWPTPTEIFRFFQFEDD